MKPVCKICGKPESEHHMFHAKAPVPKGCICNPMTWEDPKRIPKVCDKYKGNGLTYCARCEHDAACHKA